MKTYYGFGDYARRVSRLIKTMSKGGDKTLKAAKSSALFAKGIAPKQTGALIQAISWKKNKNNEAWILQRNPGHQNPARYGKAKGKPFNYAEAMRHAGRTRSMIRTGNPDYMREAARWGRKEFSQIIRAHVTKAIKTT